MEYFKEYRIVRLTAALLPQLISLHKAVYGNAPDERVLHLKYDHPNTEYAFLGYLGFDEHGQAVGFQGASSAAMAYQEETKMIAQSIDSMTHPEHGGKGLFYYLANKTYQLCKEKSMIGVMGYANQNSLPIVQKIGFKVADRLEGYSINIHTIPLEKISIKLTLLRKAYLAYQAFLFHPYKIPYTIPYSFSREDYPILLREDHLIAYKQERGVFSMQIEHTVLWLKINRDLFIGDLQCRNTKAPLLYGRHCPYTFSIV
jgi:GNAT superfamily N-acetyltransferase